MTSGPFIKSDAPTTLQKGHCALETRQLTRTMGHVEVLRAIDLKIECGEAVALRGANGAGKTTLLRCLAGALRPSAGDVLWFGKQARATVAARALIGFLGHESGLYDELTPHENLVFAARMFGHPHAVDVAVRWLEMCGLAAWKNQPVKRLSRGMRQRVSVARAMIHDPAIVLLDEPFSSLDQQGRVWIASCLQKLIEQGRTICFSSHGEEAGVGLKCRALWLQSGNLFETSKADTLHKSA